MNKKRKCKLIVLDEVNCIFVDITPDHLLYFYDKYGFFAKGYFFNPGYQLGSWDGKIRFFHKTGKTFVNLLDDLIPRLVNLGYDITMDDKRTGQLVAPELINEDFFSHIITEDGEPWKFRDYQVATVNKLIEKTSGMALIATGGGKCLLGDTLIKVNISGALLNIFSPVVEDNNSCLMNKVIITINELFNALETLEQIKFAYGVEYYQNESISIQGLNTNEYLPVNALIKKSANIYEITTNTNSVCCASHHLFIKEDWSTIKACDLSPGDRIRAIDNRITNVVEVANLWYTDDVYDLSIDSVDHVYSTANGILHHNTSMCAALAMSYEKAGNLRSIIIVPDTTLTDQTKEEYEFFGLDVGEYSGSSKDLEHQHVVATWQTLKNNPMVMQQFDMFIVDEAHAARGPILNSLLIKHGRNILYRFGCTGTLPEEESDRMSVSTAIGKVHYEIPAALLIDHGHLAKIEIDVVQLCVDLKEQHARFTRDTKDDPDIPALSYTAFKNSYFPDFSSEKTFLHSEKSRRFWIANYLESFRLMGKGNVLCLVNGVAFGKRLAKIIPNSVFLHGKDKKEVRQEIYKSFNDNDDLIVIATVNIAGTGLNIKRIFNLILIDLGKSYIRVLQSIGRGLRTAHDKDSVYVGDICSDLKYSKRHCTNRIKFYNDANYPNKKRTVDY